MHITPLYTVFGFQHFKPLENDITKVFYTKYYIYLLYFLFLLNHKKYFSGPYPIRKSISYLLTCKRQKCNKYRHFLRGGNFLLLQEDPPYPSQFLICSYFSKRMETPRFRIYFISVLRSRPNTCSVAETWKHGMSVLSLWG